jgi:hypothetical protein
MPLFRPPWGPRPFGDIGPAFGPWGPLSRRSTAAPARKRVATSVPDERALTQGEIDMASKVFGKAITYSRVKVHRGSYFPFNLQDEHTAVTPNGEIYFLPDDYRADYASSTDFFKHWFIHEMVHVWQYQLGYPVKWRGAVRIGLSYHYQLDESRKLCDYNMEAQGDLIADYFAIKVLGNAAPVHNRKNGKPYSVAAYERTLVDFLADPANKANLP